MLRRAFRLGLRVTLALGLGAAVAKLAELRRARQKRPVSSRQQDWPPVPVHPARDAEARVGPEMGAPPAPLAPPPEPVAPPPPPKPAPRPKPAPAVNPEAVAASPEAVAATPEPAAAAPGPVATAAGPPQASERLPQTDPQSQPRAQQRQAGGARAGQPDPEPTRAPRPLRAKRQGAPPAPPAPAAPAWVAATGRECPPSHPVKAKLASRLYHLPGMLAYERTIPDRCYASEEAAAADGLRRAKR